MRRKAVQDHFKTLCKEKYADQRKFWNTIRGVGLILAYKTRINAEFF